MVVWLARPLHVTGKVWGHACTAVVEVKCNFTLCHSLTVSRKYIVANINVTNVVYTL